MNDHFLHILNCLCSKQNHIINKGTDLLLILSIEDPMVVINGLLQIKLAIRCLCSSSSPHWGAVSSLVVSITNAYQSKMFLLKDNIQTILEISMDITLAYKRSTILAAGFSPSLVPFVDLVYRAMQNQQPITPKLLICFVDHCMIGFLPMSSFIPVFSKRIEEIFEIIKQMASREDTIQFERFAAPISSNERSISTFFMTLWVFLMGEYIVRENTIQALAQQSLRLFQYALEESTYGKIARYLFNCAKSSINEKESFKQLSDALKPDALKELELISKNHCQSDYGNAAVLTSKIQNDPIQKEDIQVFSKGVFSGSWNNAVLRMVLDGQFLIWGATTTQLQHGNALFFQDIISVEITDTQKKKNNNVILFKTKKDQIQMAFDSAQKAKQWLQVLNQCLDEAKNKPK